MDLAIQAGQRGVIKLLLRQGANVSPSDQIAADGTPLGPEAPLPLAASYGEDDVVRLLLRRGANINQVLRFPHLHETALAAAVYASDLSTVYLLLTHGSDITAASGTGREIPEVLRQGPIISPRMVALPALLEAADMRQPTTEWLADRVREIETSLGMLPSIAVFVDGEPEVQPIAESLGAALAEDNVRVTACPNGRVIGQDADVRVFDVQHVKGLEFEAVFFVGIDKLAASHPDRLDKFLYVGATRAATYLGATCASTLPEVLARLRTRFVHSWSDL